MLKTSLDIEKAEIRDNRRISVYSYKNVNKTLHQANRTGSLLLMWMMNCDSNNMSSKMVPSDCQVIQAQWKARKALIDLAYLHRDQPKSVIEETYEIYLPTEDEMLKFPNQKCQIVASQLKLSILASMNVDSAKAAMHLDDDDYAMISRSDEAAQAYIDTYIGTGLKKADGTYDTGLQIPALAELGQLIPDVDNDAASLQEPSADPHEINIAHSGSQE